MSQPIPSPLPSAARLWWSVLIAMLVAAVLLVTIVLPAEYGIDPTGLGRRLGLNALQGDAQDKPPSQSTPTPATSMQTSANQLLKDEATAAFGSHEGQSFDAAALDRMTALPAGSMHKDRLRISLPPGKGAEVKMQLPKDGVIAFHWTASGEVALDMHGERKDSQGTWTSYAIAQARRHDAGLFRAPFAGSHGWFWLNRDSSEVTVDIDISGEHAKLYRP